MTHPSHNARPLIFALMLFASALGPMAARASSTYSSQISPWVVSILPMAGAGRRACTAHATFAAAPLARVLFQNELQVFPQGRVIWRLSLASPVPPQWTKLDAWNVTKPGITKILMKFDLGASFEVTEKTFGLQRTEFELGSADVFLPRFAASKYFAYQSIAASQSQPAGRTATASPDWLLVVPHSTGFLSAELQKCVASLRNGTDYSATSSPIETLQVDDIAPLPDRLREAQQQVSTASPDIEGMALLRLASAQEEATQFGAAKANMEKAITILNGDPSADKTLQESRTRLEEVLLALEDIPSAVINARTLADPRLSKAEIELMVGEDDDEAKKELVSLINQTLGASLKDLSSLDGWFNLAPISITAAGRGRALRSILTSWAEISLDQAEVTTKSDYNPWQLDTNPVPASSLAELAFGSADPASLRSDRTAANQDRHDYACLAYLRGEALRRAGMIGDAEPDLQFAAFKSRGTPGAEACAFHADLALAALKADKGQTTQALKMAMDVTAAIDRDLGQNSKIWAEAALLVADLQLRDGSPQLAYSIADQAARKATSTLSPEHSLTMRLRLKASQALIAEGHIDSAILMIRNAVGIKAQAVSQWIVFDLARQLLDDISVRHPSTTIKTVIMSGQRPRVMIRPFFSEGVIDEIRKEIREEVDDPQVTHRSATFPDHADVDIAANSALSLYRLMPGDLRVSIRAGSEMSSLEYFIERERKAWEASVDTGAPLFKIKSFWAGEGLLLATSATSGDSYATIALRAKALEGLSNQVAPDAASTELYRKRLRATLLSAMDDASSPPTDEQRAQIRQTYLASLDYSGEVGQAILEGGVARNALGNAMESDHGPAERTANDLARTLNPDEAAVIWFPLEQLTEIWIIRQGRANWRSIPIGRDQLTKKIEPLMQALAVAKHAVDHWGSPRLSEFPLEQSAELYHILFDPIEHDLADVHTLYLSPLGVTGRLPMRTLVTAMPVDGGAPQWLGDRFAILRMPGLSADLLSWHHKSHAAPRQALIAFGDPIIIPSENEQFSPAERRLLPPNLDHEKFATAQ